MKFLILFFGAMTFPALAETVIVCDDGRQYRHIFNETKKAVEINIVGDEWKNWCDNPADFFNVTKTTAYCTTIDERKEKVGGIQLTIKPQVSIIDLLAFTKIVETSEGRKLSFCRPKG